MRPTPLAAGDRELGPDDRSVQVHACHGPARQVEVLREVLLGLLADDRTLEPRDILVMCPDIEAYAPLITAAFGMAAVAERDRHHPGHRLRVMLADRALTQTNPLLAVVSTLLDVAGGRAEASPVLDLMTSAPVRRRFGLTENDLETITGWVETAGIRWAFDDASPGDRTASGTTSRTPGASASTASSRGSRCPDDAQRFFGPTLPLDDVATTNIDLAGRLAECLDRLAARHRPPGRRAPGRPLARRHRRGRRGADRRSPAATSGSSPSYAAS